MQHLLFQDNQIHSTYSDGEFSLEDIFEYNRTHDRLDLTVSDHVDKNTDWFATYVSHLTQLREKYKDFEVTIGCEVKILDDCTLNTTQEILDQTEVVLGSVHHFDGIKTMSKDELLKREYELTLLLAQNETIDILAHPFSMGVRMHKADVPREWVEEVYQRCVKNGIKFECNYKNSPPTVKNFIKALIERNELEHLSFGSDMHDNLTELGQSSYAFQKVPTILITGGGTAIAQGILKGLTQTAMKTRAVIADISPLAAGLYAGDKAYIVPKFSDTAYIPKIIEICKLEGVEAVFVGLDPELELFAQNAKRIEEETGAKVIVSSLSAVQIADDKWKTVQFLKENNFPYAVSCLKPDIVEYLKTAKFPLIVKPRVGARSVGLYKVENEGELTQALSRTQEPVIQEYLSSEEEEYTCSGYFLEGKCYGVLCGKRWLRDGDTYKAVFKHDTELEEFISSVGEKLDLFGPCNFQLRKTDKGPVIFEINSRFSGTTGAMSYLGLNIASALLQTLFLNRPPSKLSFKEGYMFRYWNELFVTEDQVRSLEEKGSLENPSSTTNTLMSL